ncbi:hypothetical protein F3Y22_tig00013680pilonHSYRG00053 [Hibiscus syriacus]|uniref:RNase H type-1 domain-containing protein n=1 Tax=Hibiscus syriacus TaxID=106335 RepID=A0A6A3C3X9_HIBSY|nr:hypothetical protein F3Y22_tig00013680pilonHSYRG00053 [Hibiscus syriacus]
MVYSKSSTFRNKLLTNDERCKRGISESASCHRCSCSIESVLHVLRDCPSTSALWNRILPPNMKSSFFNLDIHSWIHMNIMANSIHPIWGMPWKFLFGAFSWSIWKRKNEFYFNAGAPSDSEVKRSSLNWASYFNGILINRSSNSGLQQGQKRWRAPDSGCCCLNVDGAVSQPSGEGAIDGLIRDNDGNWIIGFHKAVGILDALHAELWAMHDGLLFSWQQGFESFQL